MSLLIVDHRPDRLSELQTLLTQLQRWNVMATGSTSDALQMISSGGIELVLTDLMPPRQGGLELCLRIQELPEAQQVPAVVLLDPEDRGHLDGIYAAGACDYLVRPLHIAEAAARVQAVLRAREENSRRVARERKLEAVNRKLQKLVAVDPVTGVANRRAFDEALGRIWRSGARYSLHTSLIMLDVDCFKAYNDRLGHPAGDECLKRVAGSLAKALFRPDDFLARYGGEEFAVILPRTDLRGACLVAERLRTGVQKLGIHHPASPMERHITVSQGVACLVPNRDGDAGTLVALADRALYEAKEAGRNRVSAAGNSGRLSLFDFAASQSQKRTHGCLRLPVPLSKP